MSEVVPVGPGDSERNDRRPLAALIMKFIGEVRAEARLFLGIIESPTDLRRAIEENCKAIEAYIQYLPDELKEKLCENIDLNQQPSYSNPMFDHLGDQKVRMDGQAAEHFSRHTWFIYNTLESYISEGQIHNEKIMDFRREFVSKYRWTRRKDLPKLLRELCADIESTNLKVVGH